MSTHRRADPPGWHVRELAALDLETTGVDPWTDRVVSYAIVDGRGVRSGLVDPGVPVPAAAAAVHGIDSSALAQAPSSAVAVAHVLAWLEQVVEWRVPIVVFNAPYDLTMLAAEARRHGYTEPDWSRLVVIDPMVIDWGLDRDRRGPRRLGDVATHYGVTLTHAHDATADAVAALEVARAIGAARTEAGGVSAVELMRRQAEWFADRSRDWNGWAADNGRELADPAGWPLARDPGRIERDMAYRL